MTYAPQITETTEEGRAFLQRRVGLFGLTLSLFGGAMLAWQAIEVLVRGTPAELARPVNGWHALGALATLAIWLVVRRGRPSPTAIRIIEGVGLLLSASAYVVMGTYIPEIARPDYILLIVMMQFLFARAVYVPSTARHTALLGVLLGFPLLAGIFYFYVAVDPQRYELIDPQIGQLDVGGLAPIISISSLVWWSGTVVLATFATRVIYGLRHEATRAKQLGQYTLVQKLGEGGMGIVYRARHAMLRRPTAVKLLLPDKAGAAALARFEKEVQLTASLTHPNTVRVFDYGRTPEHLFYYAMELLDGPNLQEVVALDGPEPPGRVVHLMAQAAGALAEAHGVGLIHRDIKPANIMLVVQGGVPDVVKVVDFGLVKEVDQGPSASVVTDVITGTPQYMPPESITDPSSVDARSDIYSLGAVAYFLLAGDHVFRGKSVIEVCDHHLHTAPEPIGARRGEPIPARLEALVLACLEKEPTKRPASASALRSALLEIAKDVPWGEREAKEWWEVHGGEVRRSMMADAPSTPGPRTFSIDMTQRAASSAPPPFRRSSSG